MPKGGAEEATFISRAIHAAMETQEVGIARSFVTKLLKEENVEALESGGKTLEDLSVNVSLMTPAFVTSGTFDCIYDLLWYCPFLHTLPHKLKETIAISM